MGYDKIGGDSHDILHVPYGRIGLTESRSVITKTASNDLWPINGADLALTSGRLNSITLQWRLHLGECSAQPLVILISCALFGDDASLDVTILFYAFTTIVILS
jgi:hypothetical protein